jgi:hypothetical protein
MCLTLDLYLIQDENITSLKRTEKDDAREIKSFYEK